MSGVLLDGEAKVGATLLQGFVGGLTLREEVTTTVVAHSYGSLVTGIALRSGFKVDNVAVIGSPGIGAGHVDDLNLPDGTDLWAGRAPFDPVTHSEWHGADPTDPRFGGRRFETGQGTDETFPVGHSSYFEPGSDSLVNLARIVTNHEHLVTEVAPTLVDRANMAVDAAQSAVGTGGQWASSGVDHAQSAVDSGAGAAGGAVDWAQRRFDDAMDHVPGGGFVSDGINAPVDVAQAGAGAALDAGQAVIDSGQAAADALADGVGARSTLPRRQWTKSAMSPKTPGKAPSTSARRSGPGDKENPHVPVSRRRRPRRGPRRSVLLLPWILQPLPGRPHHR